MIAVCGCSRQSWINTLESARVEAKQREREIARACQDLEMHVADLDQELVHTRVDAVILVGYSEVLRILAARVSRARPGAARSSRYCRT